MVTDESPLASLFRPEEVEQLVCGSHVFDFEELQNATEYDGGFTAQTETIVHFWYFINHLSDLKQVLIYFYIIYRSVVHELSVEDKRRFLQFTTGSDRAPVGGLGNFEV